ncbi:MAG: GTP 3',8-cyclase MoaA [Pyrinomonadaceae bacterium]|nr:GTP 3',8-cyclase MoaA [Pyrinomonadaceae bacterium]
MLQDAFDRPIRDLRISVTDRCNFRCTYCMPLDEYVWMDKQEILTFSEIARIATLFVRLGVSKIRLTGGEPLARKDLNTLIARLSLICGLEDLCLTTNGSLLAEQVEALARAGLKRVNVSIDTLDPEKFRRMTKRGNLEQVLAGLFAARAQGLHPIKLNAVVERGVNDDDIIPLAEFARKQGFQLRFIEYMDVGNANNWVTSKVVPKKEILQKIHAHLPLEKFGSNQGHAPSVDYRYADGNGEVGVIASMTKPFCSNCTRARLTADGRLVTCLFSLRGHDLKALLRGGATDGEISAMISKVWRARTDRYSDQRRKAINSDSGYHAGDHRKLEMISLGG